MQAISFWLTFALALGASLLSAYCLRWPVLSPRSDPYYFVGQWFLWAVTPMLCAIIAISFFMPRFKIWDLVAVFVAVIASRRIAERICAARWRRKIWSSAVRDFGVHTGGQVSNRSNGDETLAA